MALKLPGVADLGPREALRPQAGVASIDSPRPRTNVGDTLVAGGADFQRLFEQEQERVNKLRAEDALNQLLDVEQELSIGDKGFGHIEGGNAVAREVPLVKEYGDQFAERRKAIAAKLPAGAREFFERRADPVQRQFGAKTLIHVAKQRDIYEKQVLAGAESAAITNAGNDYASDASVETYLDRYNFVRGERGRNEGEPQDVIDRDIAGVRDKVWAARLTAEAAKDPVGAYARFQKNADQMSPAMARAVEAQLFSAADDLLATRAQGAMGGLEATPAQQGVGGTAQPRPGSAGAKVEARGIRNNNPGNIIKSARSWEGEVPGTDARYATFETPEAGIAALGKNLLAYNDRHGLNTVQGIISRWAPSSENDTGAYVARVSRELGVKADQPLDLRDKKTLTALTKSIVATENGGQPYTDAQISGALDTALKPGGGERRTPQTQPSIAVSLATMTPAQAAGVTTGDPMIDALPPHRKLAVLQKANTIARQESVQLRHRMEGRVRDTVAALERGVEPPNAPSESELILTYGQLDGLRVSRELGQARQFGLDVKSVATMPPTEQAAMLATRAPQAGEGFAVAQQRHEQLARAVEQTNKAKTDDPGAFVIQFAPTVQRAYQASVQAPAEQRAAMTQAFAEASFAEQRRLGVEEPKLLPKAIAEQIVREFVVPREGGAQSATQFIQGQEQQWGPYWPQVYKQIAKDIGTTARVVSNLRDTPAAAVLSMHANIKTPELRKPIPTPDAKTVDDTVEAELLPFRQSVVGWTTGGNTAYNDYDEQAKRLAYVYTSQGTKPAEAAKRAAREVVGDYYEFRGKTRIPKAVDAAVTEAGMTAVLKSADTLTPKLPEAEMKALGKDFTQKQVGAALRSKGFFVTLGDDSGVALHMEGANGARAVEGADGKPIVFTWRELAQKATEDQRAPGVTQFGNTEGGAATGRTVSRYGNRPDGSAKGLGFFGELRRPDGNVSTELSVEYDDVIGGKPFPLIVPTLTKKEVDTLLALPENAPTPRAIADKAIAHAEKRVREGKSPFAGRGEQVRVPR